MESILPKRSCERIGDAIAAPPQPWWLVEGRRQLANTWELYGPKSHRIVRLEGDLRYYCWLLLESDSTITQICEDPVLASGRSSHGTWPRMDFWCRLQNGDELYLDVRYFSRIATIGRGSDIATEMEAKTKWAALHNAAFALATDKLVTRCPFRLANWSVILRYLALHRRADTRELSLLVRRSIAALGPQMIGDLESLFSAHRADVQTTLFRELHAGTLTADLSNGIIGYNTVIALPASHGAFLPELR